MERKRTPASFVPWAVAFLVMALVLPVSLQAQETRGKITGRVTDASKAIIPGATVTVTDVASGSVNTTTTNEQGLFQVNYLVPGTYKVVIELSGFKKNVQESVQVQINQTRDLAIVLEVGAMEESVSVVAEAVTLNTADANMGLIGGSESPRQSPADTRRSLQDHRTCDWRGAHGRPAAGSAVRADAHHRVRLSTARAATAATSDRRLAEHRHGEQRSQ